MQFTVHAGLLGHSGLGSSTGRLETEMLKFQVVLSPFGQLPASQTGKIERSLKFYADQLKNTFGILQLCDSEPSLNSTRKV